MNPQMTGPAPTPVPIHDIAGPIGFFPYPIWMVAAAAAVVLLLLGLAIWFFIVRRKPAKVRTPAERALAALTRLRGNVASAEPYPFSIEVSDVLRGYLRDEYGLNAPTQTSREFLDTVATRSVFNDDEKSMLRAFLETADLVKFARFQASAAECTTLLDQADRLVKSGTKNLKEGAK